MAQIRPERFKGFYRWIVGKEGSILETISGLTNWRLTLRREGEGVRILRAVTCDRRAVLPETLCGLPVVALGDRALAHGAAPLAGEELLVTGGPEEGEWDNRAVRELTLPAALREIGDYAFLNMRELETLRFSDALQSFGSASFMNCRAFARVELTRVGPGQGPALASLVHSLQQELDVTVFQTDGSCLRLIFPEYAETYDENIPAHHFQLKIVGGGYAYHGVFRDKKLSLQEYDGLWQDYVSAEHDASSALRLAYCRLRWSAELTDRARERYEAHLRQNQRAALFHALRERDAEGLRLVLALGTPDDAALSAALDEARRLRDTGAAALLLEQRRRAQPGRKYML